MFWTLNEDGADILLTQITARYQSITKFAQHLKTHKIARQTVSRFLKGEPVRIQVAKQICEALLEDLEEFRTTYVRFKPSPRLKVQSVTPDLGPLLLEAYLLASNEERKEFETLLTYLDSTEA